MKNRRLLSLVMALVVVFSLSVSASAAVTVEWDKARYESAATKIKEVPADLSESADEAMHWMVMNKVMNGVDAAGNLAPKASTTRAHIAQMLLNLSNVK